MRRVLLLILCCLLLMPLLASFQTGYAADSYLITVVEETVVEDVGDNAMAVYMDGIVYVPYSVLSGARGINVNYNTNDRLVTVFRAGNIIRFELATGLTYDVIQQRTIAVPARMRGGVPYLPLSVVTAWMDMYSSVTYLEDSEVNYPVIRLASSTSPAVSDSKVFSDNQQKLRDVSQARDRLSGIGVTPGNTSAPPPVTPPPLPTRYTTLLFTGLTQPQEGEESVLSEILTTLERFSLGAAFFLSEEDTQTGAESLREIYSRGFTPGILITDGEAPLDQARRVSEWFAQAGLLRARLVYCGELELTPEQLEELEAAGFVVWFSDLDPYEGNSRRTLLGRVQASLRNAAARSVLRLAADEDTRDNLAYICSYLSGQNFVVEPVYEWTAPPALD